MTETLSDQIASILNSAPVSYDPEDDVHEETVARVEVGTAGDYSDDEEELNLSKFRKENFDLLEDTDERYKGKKASRKTIEDLNEFQSQSEESSDDFTGASKTNETDENTNSEDDDVSEIDDDSATSDNRLDGTEDKEDLEHFQSINESNQIRKGSCVRQQLNMWENLLEVRIQLQKCLIAANKFPQPSTFANLKSTCENQFINKVVETKKSATNLLDKFLYLQLLLLKVYPETKELLVENKHVTRNESDEEIPSDTEEEDSKELSEYLNDTPIKKLKLSEYDSLLSKRFTVYKTYQNSIIEKWNNKTKIAKNKSENTTNSVTNQIEHILSNKEKLIKRTQLKRDNYEILGNEFVDDDDDGEVYNSNIFDDTDFYHQLLRELIEFKSADLTDPVQLGRQWIQLQNLRSKMKRNIDTRATKGRKIRYAVHSKLVNFMSPIDDCIWQREAESELYNSLFGKNQPTNVV